LIITQIPEPKEKGVTRVSGPEPRPGVLDFTAHMVDLPLQDGTPSPTLLASNECALGPSPRAVEAASAAMADVHLYPERQHADLATAIATRFGLDPAHIACGNGSDELLARLARAFLRPGDELIYLARGYQKFPKYALMESARPMPVPDRDLLADVDNLLAAVTDRTRIVMLANPDNPSGRHLRGGEVRRLHAGLPDGVLLVLDSAYAEYVGAENYEPPDRLIEETANLVMTRTFSKIFGLAGARLGWLYGAPAIVDAVRRVGATYPISTASAAAGIAALSDGAHTRLVRAHNDEWRAWLTTELMDLGLHVYPSQTNFVLTRFDRPGTSAEAAYDFLAARGIVPRLFTGRNFQNHMRITIGPAQDLRRFVASLRDYLEA
jgi:histidinol-phosphate aminotransferase